MPSGSELARFLASEHRYPLTDAWNLPRVAQYVATAADSDLFPKRKVATRLQQLAAADPPDLMSPGSPYSILAGFRVPVYVTTNYDGFMSEALEAAGRPADRAVAAWNRETMAQTVTVERVPTPEQPLVFHFHGRLEMPASMVLTEDDYVAFAAETGRDISEVIHPHVQRALAWRSLLFVGYSLQDWNFRVVLRAVLRELAPEKRLNVSVQLPPSDAQFVLPGRHADVEQFLAGYLLRANVRVAWGDMTEFLTELAARCDQQVPG